MDNRNGRDWIEFIKLNLVIAISIASAGFLGYLFYASMIK